MRSQGGQEPLLTTDAHAEAAWDSLTPTEVPQPQQEGARSQENCGKGPRAGPDIWHLAPAQTPHLPPSSSPSSKETRDGRPATHN